ncbi:MAG: SDR family NAD(P)-dependent oxidoreductase [Acidimicrobiia bacterium]
MSSQQFSGRVAVVTGATRGIGRATARMLARNGASLVIAGRSTAAAPSRLLPGTLEEAQAELTALGVDVVSVPADLASADDTQAIIDATLARFGRCDILINNAAYMPSSPVMSTSANKLMSAVRINAAAPLQLCQGFVPGMLERGWGRVLNVSSGASQSAPPALFAYGASKIVMERLTEALGAELAGRGVSISAVQVAEVATEMWELANSSGLMDAQGTPSSNEVFDPAAVAEAFRWILEGGDDSRGRVWAFDELTAAGVIRPRP